MIVFLAPLLVMSAAVTQADVPPVPGLCTAPVPIDRDAPGCYKTSELALHDVGQQLYWHIHGFTSESKAMTEARRHRYAATTEMHGQAWLYVLGGPSEQITGGIRRAVIGPLAVPSADTIAHFAAATFPPGMRTRVHAHPGAEAFYVVSGEQCMETPAERRTIAAGETYIVKDGPHLQAAPKGRRNLVLILVPRGIPLITLRTDWHPTGFCDR